MTYATWKKLKTTAWTLVILNINEICIYIDTSFSRFAGLVEDCIVHIGQSSTACQLNLALLYHSPSLVPSLSLLLTLPSSSDLDSVSFFCSAPPALVPLQKLEGNLGYNVYTTENYLRLLQEARHFCLTNLYNTYILDTKILKDHIILKCHNDVLLKFIRSDLTSRGQMETVVY